MIYIKKITIVLKTYIGSSGTYLTAHVMSNRAIPFHGPLARYVKSRVAHALGVPGTFSPPPRVSDPDMHFGTCVTHVPWCMPGSLTRGILWSWWRETFSAFPAHAQPAILRTVETLYSTIYYSKYFIELNIDKSTQYVALWTHKRHPIPRPFGRAMERLLWVLQQKLIVL